MEPHTKPEPTQDEQRITIADLPVMEDMSSKEQKTIIGGDLGEDPFNQLN